MIDIHSHVLQAVDDGCLEIDTALAMLKEAVALGIKHVILTPHFRGEYACDKETLQREFERLKEKAQECNIDVNLYLGQEIYVEKGYKAGIKDGKLLTLNNTNFVLIEFDFEYPSDIVNTVYDLKISGYQPIVAHIERYGYVDLRIADEVKKEGGLIQINAESIVSIRNFKFRRRAMQLIKYGLVDFVASDVHGERKNLMQKAFNKVKRRFGKQTALKLFKENAKEIIQGQS